MDDLIATAKISIMVKHALEFRRITGELPPRDYFVDLFHQPRELVDKVYIHLVLLVPKAVLRQTENEVSE